VATDNLHVDDCGILRIHLADDRLGANAAGSTSGPGSTSVDLTHSNIFRADERNTGKYSHSFNNESVTV
jgi:hypothetical protein